MGQQGPPARDAASAARARRVARGSLLLTTRTASRRAKATGSFRSAPRVLDPDRKNKNNIFSTRRNAATWPTSDRNSGRLQIGTGGRLQVGMHGRLRRNPQAPSALIFPGRVGTPPFYPSANVQVIHPRMCKRFLARLEALSAYSPLPLQFGGGHFVSCARNAQVYRGARKLPGSESPQHQRR